MTRSRRAALPAALALLVLAALGGAAERSAAETAKTRLAAFGSCGQLLDYAKSNASRLVGPYGLGSPIAIADTTRAAAPPEGKAVQGVDFSGTNVQEEGVDEPDIVKTDGDTLYAVANGKLNAVDVRDPKPRLLDTLALGLGQEFELLLHGDRLLVLSRGGYFIDPQPGIAARIGPYQPSQSVMSEINVSDPKRLRLVRTLTLDGQYVAARLVGGSVRIVVSAQVPSKLPFAQPTSGTKADLATATRRNRAVVASSRLVSWLPTYRVKRAGAKAGAARPLVQCRHVRRPTGFSGLGMLTVLTVDLAKGIEPVNSVSVMTDGRIVYASTDSLYVATERWVDRPNPATPENDKEGVRTAIHKFDISDSQRAQYRGSGDVSGYLLSQWSLSEHRGVLRVVSTESPAWWGPGGGGGAETESFLTTLRPTGGTLVQAGRIGGLGRGERVYSVRMIGDTGYVVTFRQIDPLYTIDLAVPERPRVLGELKIPGYSAYLHPVGDDLLLGIGQDANEEGRPLGTQISLFDVSDLRRPTRLHKEHVGLGWSEAESDHHAFLYWPRTGLMVIPLEQRAVGYRISRARGIAAAGRIDHEAGKLSYTAGVRRSLVVRDSVLTVSDAGVKSSSLATLAERGWAAFPPPEGPIR
ncbi:MAG: beta-propeller domain-containing protein [Actinobacteria bacterium]|nr:beta-propeller domain-containing protein [Actinomycetota bacterium]